LVRVYEIHTFVPSLKKVYFKIRFGEASSTKGVEMKKFFGMFAFLAVCSAFTLPAMAGPMCADLQSARLNPHAATAADGFVFIRRPAIEGLNGKVVNMAVEVFDMGADKARHTDGTHEVFSCVGSGVSTVIYKVQALPPDVNPAGQPEVFNAWHETKVAVEKDSLQIGQKFRTCSGRERRCVFGTFQGYDKWVTLDQVESDSPSLGQVPPRTTAAAVPPTSPSR